MSAGAGIFRCCTRSTACTAGTATRGACPHPPVRHDEDIAMGELVRLKHVGDAARRALNLIPHTHHEDVAHRKRSKFRHVERDAANGRQQGGLLMEHSGWPASKSGLSISRAHTGQHAPAPVKVPPARLERAQRAPDNVEGCQHLQQAGGGCGREQCAATGSAACTGSRAALHSRWPSVRTWVMTARGRNSRVVFLGFVPGVPQPSHPLASTCCTSMLSNADLTCAHK
jgi:hypothetical protein